MGAGDAGVCPLSTGHVTCCTKMNRATVSKVRSHLRHEFVLPTNLINFNSP